MNRQSVGKSVVFDQNIFEKTGQSHMSRKDLYCIPPLNRGIEIQEPVCMGCFPRLKVSDDVELKAEHSSLLSKDRQLELWRQGNAILLKLLRQKK